MSVHDLLPPPTPAGVGEPPRAGVGVVAVLGLIGLGLLLGTAGSAAASAPVGVSPAVASTPAQVTPDVVGEVTVEPTGGLPAQGAVVTVTGTGFDPAAGIYVAVCVDNGPGVKASPCIGGVDTEGAGGATWISDNPPTYAEGLTVPYGPGGSFEVELPVPVVDEVTGVDCREITCAVTVRYDHLRADDRGADHVIPVTFAGEDTAGEGDGAADADGSQDAPGSATSDGFPVLPVALAGVAVLVLAGVLLLRRRRRQASDDSPVTTPAKKPSSSEGP